jgi:hypothetical protein
VGRQREVIHLSLVDSERLCDELAALKLVECPQSIVRQSNTTFAQARAILGIQIALKRNAMALSAGVVDGGKDWDLAHHLNARRNHDILVARRDRLRRKVDCLLRRAALPVDRRARYTLGQP